MKNIDHTPDIEQYKSKIMKLKEDNRNLRQDIALLNQQYKGVLNMIPTPLIIFDKGGVIAQCNLAFTELLDFRGRELTEKYIELVGRNVADIVFDELNTYITSYLISDDTFFEKNITIRDSSYCLTVKSIVKRQYGVAIFKPLISKEELGEEMIARLTDVIDSNLSMIQKIGSIMGEEVSQSTETISSIIKLIKH